jgi:hypothetical protein
MININLAAPVEQLGKHLGLVKQSSPFTSFYSLEAEDIDGVPIDFEAYRNKARGGLCGRGRARLPHVSGCLQGLRLPVRVRARVRALTTRAGAQVVMLVNVPVTSEGTEVPYKARGGRGSGRAARHAPRKHDDDTAATENTAPPGPPPRPAAPR